MKLASVLIACAVLAPALAPTLVRAEGEAAVRVVRPQRGGAPTEILAYGQAAPASRAVRSLTLAQTGQVSRVEATAGQAVRRGQVLLRFDVAPTAIAAYRQAQTALALARSQQTHSRLLLGEQLATRDQAAAADKAVQDAESQLAALAKDGAGRPVALLTAPFDGVIVSLPVSLGDRPAAGAVLATLVPSTAVQVTVGVEPGYRRQIRPGAAARLEPIGGGPAVTGRVVRIDAVLNPKTRLVDVDIAAPPGAALSGEAFRVRLETGRVDGWRVPHGAVRVEDGKAFVFQLDGRKAAKVAVRVLQPGRDTDVVDGPIVPDRPLVTVGAYQLDDGDTVRVER